MFVHCVRVCKLYYRGAAAPVTATRRVFARVFKPPSEAAGLLTQYRDLAVNTNDEHARDRTRTRPRRDIKLGNFNRTTNNIVIIIFFLQITLFDG